ncbi:hypothetical protein ABEB36_006852 [Hypothenemus hampei]
MLTNIGKLRQYNLGQYFRQRYPSFLPAIYSEKDIYVRSTDVDRTIMSAASNLAGLYPPVGTDIWNENIAWQPIPIHTLPQHEDPILAAKKPCKKYDFLQKQLFQTAYFRNISHVNHDLYAYLSKYSGQTISDIEKLEYLYSTFQIETWNNFTLPDWAKKVYPQKMEKWAALSFATPTFTEDLARLKTGPFFFELLEYFRNRTETPRNAQYFSPKFMMYSAHDTTIASLLNSMGAFEYHCPPYTATIIFELHRPKENSWYINIFYKNTSEARLIKVKDCSFDCDWQYFQQILSPITINTKQWESECNSLLLFSTILNFYILIGALVVSLIGITVLLLLVRRRARANRNLYSQLPEEEYA